MRDGFLALALLSSPLLFLGCDWWGHGGPDCDDARCSCISISEIAVLVPGAMEEHLVTAEGFECTPTSAERSHCMSVVVPAPQMATVVSEGYAPLEVTLTPVSAATPCCPCEGIQNYRAQVALVPLGGDGGSMVDGGR
jgi:hypothetical protein